MTLPISFADVEAAAGRLHGIAHRHGTLVLCVSHDPRLINHADRVLAMEDGRLLSLVV